MSETSDEQDRGEELKARVTEWATELKAELADRVDQALDELGARIGGE